MPETIEYEQEIFRFLKENLRLEVHEYAIPSGPTIRLILCDEVISEVSLQKEESIDGY